MSCRAGRCIPGGMLYGACRGWVGFARALVGTRLLARTEAEHAAARARGDRFLEPPVGRGRSELVRAHTQPVRPASARLRIAPLLLSPASHLGQFPLGRSAVGPNPTYAYRSSLRCLVRTHPSASLSCRRSPTSHVAAHAAGHGMHHAPRTRPGPKQTRATRRLACNMQRAAWLATCHAPHGIRHADGRRPKLKQKHVVLDLCLPTGELERRTVAKSHGPEVRLRSAHGLRADGATCGTGL